MVRFVSNVLKIYKNEFSEGAQKTKATDRGKNDSSVVVK
jgi:hypothetical protein